MRRLEERGIATRQGTHAAALQGVYAEILKRIEANNYDVMTQRVSLSSREKLTAIGKLWVKATMVRPA